MGFFSLRARSFHLTVCFYPIPALHFAENFAALPALWRGKCSISKIGLFVNRGRKLNTKLDLAQLSEITVTLLSSRPPTRGGEFKIGCETLAVVRLLSCAENSKRTTTRFTRRRSRCRSMPLQWRHLRFTVQRRWSPKEDGRCNSTSFYDLSIPPHGVFCARQR